MALDGDLDTAWRANAFGDARGQRIRIDLDGPITTDHVNLVQQLTGGHNRWITDVALRFDGKDTMHATLGDASHSAAGQTSRSRARTFHTLEITVDATTDMRTNLFGTADAVGFAEIRLRDEHATHDVRRTRSSRCRPTSSTRSAPASASTRSSSSCGATRCARCRRARNPS